MSVQNVAMGHSEFPNRIPNVVDLLDRSIVKPVRRWHNRRKAIAELSRLDDRMLADIGIMRNEITQVVEGIFADDAGAYAPPTPPAHRTR